MPTLLPSEAQVRGNPTKSVADATRVRGAFQSVADHTARDSLDPDVRKAGMWVKTVSDGIVWELQSDLATWTPAQVGSGSASPQLLASAMGPYPNTDPVRGPANTAGLSPFLNVGQLNWFRMAENPNPPYGKEIGSGGVTAMWFASQSGYVTRVSYSFGGYYSFSTLVSLAGTGQFQSVVDIAVGGGKAWVATNYGLVRIYDAPDQVQVEAVSGPYEWSIAGALPPGASFAPSAVMYDSYQSRVILFGYGQYNSSVTTTPLYAIIDPLSMQLTGFGIIQGPPDTSSPVAAIRVNNNIVILLTDVSGTFIVQYDSAFSGSLVANPSSDLPLPSLQSFGNGDTRVFFSTSTGLGVWDTASPVSPPIMPWGFTAHSFCIGTDLSAGVGGSVEVAYGYDGNAVQQAIGLEPGSTLALSDYSITLLGQHPWTTTNNFAAPVLGTNITFIGYSRALNKFVALDAYNDAAFLFNSSAIAPLSALGSQVNWGTPQPEPTVTTGGPYTAYTASSPYSIPNFGNGVNAFTLAVDATGAGFVRLPSIQTSVNGFMSIKVTVYANPSGGKPTVILCDGVNSIGPQSQPRLIMSLPKHGGSVTLQADSNSGGWRVI